jgi:hypothetical protein
VDEKTYLTAMAKEVLLSQDSRILKLVAWCEKINKMISACGGDEVTQNAHAAATAAMLVMEMNYIEETGAAIDPHTDVNAFNRMDTTLPKYFYTADFVKRTITLSVAIVDAKTERQLGGYRFEDITIPMRELPEGMQPVSSNSPIIMPE